jgi:hypothetical protein
MKKGDKNKKAEGFLGMGFGMIFSIFLIIIFIIIAIYAIKAFLDFQKCSQIGLFIRDFQDEVNNVFNSQSNGIPFKRNLPSNLQYVCFGNLSKTIKGSNMEIGEDLAGFSIGNDNMFFYPRENACNLKTKYVSHLNMGEIIKNNNPYCIPVIKGKITIKISKGFNEGLVKISS